MPKLKKSNATFWVIFKHCVLVVAKRYSVWIFFTSFCGYRSYSRQKLLHRFLSQLFVASHWGLSGGRETSLRFLAPRNKSAMKIEWETDCYSTITFFCTRSSILILKFSSQKCFFFTMFENHFKKSYFATLQSLFLRKNNLNSLKKFVKTK